MFTAVRLCCAYACVAIAVLHSSACQLLRAQPFSIQGPGVDPKDFRITTFADGLSFPVGMAALPDGSLLVGVSNGGSYFGSSSGSLIRLADTDQDGVADERTTLAASVPGGALSSVRVAGDLVFVTGQRRPISVFRLGAAASDPLTQVGRLDINYPGGPWLHPHSALAARESPTEIGAYELYFQIGSFDNANATSQLVGIGGDLGLAGDAVMHGESIYRVTIRDDGDGLAASDLTQIATGLRNAAGFDFDPVSGDFYLQDNGIDGLVDANEPTSADELNLIPADALGGDVEDFGFPHSYVQYRTGRVVGGQGIAPLVTFQPLPEPRDGAESEGPNDIALAPSAFPESLRDGVFVTMHGKFSLGGLANEENPLVFVDRRDDSYFHFISNQEPGVGHIDGLLSTTDSLFLADLSPQGGLGSSQANTGKIYQIQSLVPEPGSSLSLALGLLIATRWRRNCHLRP